MHVHVHVCSYIVHIKVGSEYRAEIYVQCTVPHLSVYCDFWSQNKYYYS